MDLQSFMFPICERSVAINNGQNDITDWESIDARCNDTVFHYHIFIGKYILGANTPSLDEKEQDQENINSGQILPYHDFLFYFKELE